MPVVLVHGNPETPIIWQPLLQRLERKDVVTPQLPGFGTAVPAGFGATKEEYVDWLVSELEAAGEPVDLVGHDWGGILAVRVACTRPDLLRSWVTDVAGLFHPEYTWHDFAHIWQTPDAGEQYFVDMLATPVETRVELYSSLGIPPDIAAPLVTAADEEMGRCILALYRSAAQPAMIEWGHDAESAAARPGLVLVNTEDPFVKDHRFATEMAARMRATADTLEGLGHWWMLQDPDRGAQVLERFWASI